MTSSPLKTTPLHAGHLGLKARMAEFAGYDMPIQYAEGVLAEHNWTRAKAGLFDVSHMGQIMVRGAEALAFFEKLTPSALRNLPPGAAKYTVLTNDQGGIIDDLIITRFDQDSVFAVINAGCKDKDIGWIRSNLPADLSFSHLEDRALLALQGPSSEGVLRDILHIDAQQLGYMKLLVSGEFYISRLGYTGEDGFEISVPAHRAGEIWNALLSHPDVRPVGLAARDSLRLEMGYPLYGHDITADMSPVEADLGWVIGKNASGYFGQAQIERHRADGPPRRRIGVKLLEKGVAREGTEILTPEGKKIGGLTSGGFSPTLNTGIGQGYVESKHCITGKDVLLRVRGRDIKGELCRLPFLPPRTRAPVRTA